MPLCRKSSRLPSLTAPIACWKSVRASARLPWRCCKGAAHVTSIERDADLPAVLAETLAPWWDKFTLIQKDALDLQLSDLNAQAMPTKLVANLPYAVAATVVLDYFQRIESLQSATVMVQKEVADRMAAEPGTKNYGAYTVKLRLYAQPAGRFPGQSEQLLSAAARGQRRYPPESHVP